MATEKIPSPEEIKNEPQKFTQEELDNLKGFQTRLDQILSQLGRVHLSKIKLNEQEDLIKEEEVYLPKLEGYACPYPRRKFAARIKNETNHSK